MSEYYGPWRIRFNQRSHRPGSKQCLALQSSGVQCKERSDGQHVAEDNTHAWDIVSSEGEIIADLSDNGYQDEEGLPIARLIAAAPELLEVLRKLANEATGFLAMSDAERHGHTNCRVLYDLIQEARTTIAMAEGK